jgi:hypothetical protein
MAKQVANFHLLALAVWAVWGFSGVSPALATRPLQVSHLLATTPPLRAYGGAIADLDGDGRPDLATVTSKRWGPNAFRYQVELTLSSRIGPSSFCVSAEAGGLRIVPRDVDGDGDLDLVITNARSFAPVGIWINDGHGEFTQGDKTAYSGSIWTQGPGIASDSTQRIFPAIAPQSCWSWLDISRGFCFWGKLPVGRLRLSHLIPDYPDITLSQPRTRAPPCSLPRLTS